MSREFNKREAELISLFLQSILYGLVLQTTFKALRAIILSPDLPHRRRTNREINWGILIGCILLLIFASFSAILQLTICIDGFIWGPDAGLESAFTSNPDWTFTMKDVCVLTVSVVGDAVMIYRCFVIYGHQWQIIISPVIFWLGDIALEIYVLYLAIGAPIPTSSIGPAVKPILIAWHILSLAFTFLTTGLVIYRIHRVERAQRSQSNMLIANQPTQNHLPILPPNRLKALIEVIIQSALMYTVLNFITFILVLVKSKALIIVSNAYVEVVAISFNLILIRAFSVSTKFQRTNTPIPSNNRYSHTGACPGRAITEVRLERIPGAARHPSTIATGGAEDTITRGNSLSKEELDFRGSRDNYPYACEVASAESGVFKRESVDLTK